MSRTFLTYKLGMPWDKHKFEPFTSTDIDRGESITDTSYYVPVAEALKKLKEGHGSVGTITYNGFFDFPAGAKIPTDGSVKPVVGRKPGLDRTEVESVMSQMASDIESKRSDIEKDVQSQVKKAERASEIKKILSTPDSSLSKDS